MFPPRFADVDIRRLPTLNGASGIANDYAELALLVSATKRLSHHVEFVTSYTWSHNLDVYSTERGGTSGGPPAW